MLESYNKIHSLIIESKEFGTNAEIPELHQLIAKFRTPLLLYTPIKTTLCFRVFLDIIIGWSHIYTPDIFGLLKLGKMFQLYEIRSPREKHLYVSCRFFCFQYRQSLKHSVLFPDPFCIDTSFLIRLLSNNI
jgi:hypothetical protein